MANRGGALRGQEVTNFFGGLTAGFVTLIYWYLVAQNAGFTANSAAAIYVPILGFQLHHEIYGIILMGIGGYLLMQRHPALKVTGAYLFGLGAAWFADDFIQHCPGGNLSACQNWP